MTDLVSPLPPVPAVTPAPRATPAPPSSAPAPETPREPQKVPPEPQRKPLTVDVQRDAGVFVYTLRDPVTDTVLAVIPRDAVRSDRDGRHVDQKA